MGRQRGQWSDDGARWTMRVRKRETSNVTLIVRCLHSQTLSIQPRFHIYLFLGKVPRRLQSWGRDAETLSCNKQSAFTRMLLDFGPPSFRGFFFTSSSSTKHTLAGSSSLSNTGQLRLHWCSCHLPCFSCMDKGVDSFQRSGDRSGTPLARPAQVVLHTCTSIVGDQESCRP